MNPREGGPNPRQVHETLGFELQFLNLNQFLVVVGARRTFDFVYGGLVL